MHTHARGGVPSRPPETAPCYVPAGPDPGTTLQQSDGMRTPARCATHAFLSLSSLSMFKTVYAWAVICHLCKRSVARRVGLCSNQCTHGSAPCWWSFRYLNIGGRATAVGGTPDYPQNRY